MPQTRPKARFAGLKWIPGTFLSHCPQTTRKESPKAKADLVENLTTETEWNRDDDKAFNQPVFEEVKALLESGQTVKLSGFGNFDLRDKRQRPGRNPKTGEDIPITAHWVVTFKPGHKLKAKVEDYSD